MSSKPCKYGCGAILTWDNGMGKFKEPDGTLHSIERCQVLKSKSQPAAQAPSNELQGVNALVQAIDRLVVAIETLSRSRA